MLSFLTYGSTIGTKRSAEDAFASAKKAAFEDSKLPLWQCKNPVLTLIDWKQGFKQTYHAKLAKILQFYDASHIDDQDDDGNRFGDTPLMKAANQGKIKYCKLLIYAGANVNAQSTGKLNSFKKGSTALYWATYQNLPEIVTLLLENNALVDLANGHNTTPLIVAVRHGSIECAKLLIAAGANVNARKKHGYNVLYYAQRNNNPQLIQLLLDAGAQAQPRRCTLL